MRRNQNLTWYESRASPGTDFSRNFPRPYRVSNSRAAQLMQLGTKSVPPRGSGWVPGLPSERSYVAIVA